MQKGFYTTDVKRIGFNHGRSKMDKGKREWTKFQVGALGKHQSWRPSCKPIDFISHVSHLCNAINIFEIEKINAGLVFDESILRKKRILVVWLSPNDWDGAGGFRYGNVRFNFDWKKLIKDMNYYWIEIIPYEKIPACRILVTPKDYSGKFLEYDPTQGDGPWWHRTTNDTHYFNGRICLEIMLERDLYLIEMQNLDFVTHNPKRCAIDPKNCPDLGLYSSHAGARFVAALIGRDSDSKIKKFFRKYPQKIDSSALSCALSSLWQDLRTLGNFNGSIQSTHETASPIVRAALGSYAKMNDEELTCLASLFKSDKSLINSSAKIIADTLNISDWNTLIPEKRRRRSHAQET